MYNNLRITGLASGIDTEEMVQSLMRAERVKVDRVEQDRQTLLWRQEIYNDLNKDFANFILNSRKMFGLTFVRYDGSFVPNSYKNLNWVKKATSSNETIATVSSTGKAMDGNYRVKVKQLAEGVNMASGDKIDGIINKDGKIIDEKNELVTELEFTIKDGSKNKDGTELEFKIKLDNTDGITINDVVKAINSAKVTVGEGENAKEVPINVRASYDASIGRFFLQTTETGEDAKIEITAKDEADNKAGINGKNFIDALNLQYRTEDKDEEGNYIYEHYKANGGAKSGKNVIINFNGADNIISSSNRITINGITMDLKAEGDFNINIATDVDGIYEKVDQFVKDYNELVDKTNKILGEKRYRDYKPLTAEQKKGMEKADIDLWEEKAKSGLLRSDDIISSTMLKTRQAIYEEFKTKDGFSGTFKLITDIGISTEPYSRGSAGGKLVIDEQKLKDAIAKNPEDVMELLFKESIPEERDKDNKVIKKGIPGGFVTRIYDNLMLGMEEIIQKSGTGENADLYRGVKGNILLDFVTKSSSISLIDKDILQYSRRIDDLNAMLFRKENNYYAKFAAMEKAISRMNQQSGWLMQQSMS